MSEGSCCGGSGVRPLLPSPSEVADAPILQRNDVDDDDVDDDHDDPGWGRKRVYEAPNQLSQYPT